jgi:hypothetical protein
LPFLWPVSLQIFRNRRELFQRGFEVGGDVGGDNLDAGEGCPLLRPE